MVGVLMLTACSDIGPKTLPTTTSPTVVPSVTTIGAEPALCQSPLKLQEVSTEFAKVIGTSPVFATGMDAAGVVAGSVNSGRLEGKILWIVETSMAAPVTVTVANLDATMAVRDQPAVQTATLEPADAVPSSSDVNFKEYPSTIAASGPGCVTVTARWPPDGSWTARLLLTDA